MDSSIISHNHLQALRFIISILTKHNIDYQLTGGVAGNIYGSQWPLHDIDIEVARKDMDRVAELFKDYITRPISRFVDDEFDLLMMTLQISEIDVDINQVEDAFVVRDGVKIKLDSDLSRANRINWQGIEILVQPLDDIIHYKEIIRREADLAELKQLAISSRNSIVS